MPHTGFHHPPALCHGPHQTFSCSSQFKLNSIIHRLLKSVNRNFYPLQILPGEKVYFSIAFIFLTPAPPKIPRPMLCRNDGTGENRTAHPVISTVGSKGPGIFVKPLQLRRAEKSLRETGRTVSLQNPSACWGAAPFGKESRNLFPVVKSQASGLPYFYDSFSSL